jgi:hypothetical protein
MTFTCAHPQTRNDGSSQTVGRAHALDEGKRVCKGRLRFVRRAGNEP